MRGSKRRAAGVVTVVITPPPVDGSRLNSVLPPPATPCAHLCSARFASPVQIRDSTQCASPVCRTAAVDNAPFLFRVQGSGFRV